MPTPAYFPGSAGRKESCVRVFRPEHTMILVERPPMHVTPDTMELLVLGHLGQRTGSTTWKHILCCRVCLDRYAEAVDYVDFMAVALACENRRAKQRQRARQDVLGRQPN